MARLGRETEAEAQVLRDACALACLTRIGDIITAYDLAPTVLDGQEVDDRAVDLWAPLLALAMVADAQRLGLAIMAGCMVATSLSMAPAMLIAQTACFVDLDGPLLLARDREHGLLYEGSIVHPAATALWG